MSLSLQPMPNEPKRLGMDELSFFVQMVKFLVNDADPVVRNSFWHNIHHYCPNLSHAILGSAFTGEYAHILFTRSITSAAFSTDDNHPSENGQRKGDVQHNDES